MLIKLSTQIVDFLFGVPDCDTHLDLLDLSLSFDPRICSAVALPPFENDSDMFGSVSIDFH